jgi:hypothetical protein
MWLLSAKQWCTCGKWEDRERDSRMQLRVITLGSFTTLIAERPLDARKVKVSRLDVRV